MSPKPDQVAPLAANAPVAADGAAAFGWHIDADPVLLPPSPWTDVYGRRCAVCRRRPPPRAAAAAATALSTSAPPPGPSNHYTPPSHPPAAPTRAARRPNRAPGAPRFVSALVYLSPCWQDAWGAPTRLLDP